MNVKKRKAEMSASVPKEEGYYRLALLDCGEPVLGVRVNGAGHPQPLWLVNAAARQLLGYSAEECKRLSLASLGLSQQEVQRLLQNGRLLGALGTRGGQSVYVEMRSRVLTEECFVVTLQPVGVLTAPPVSDRPSDEGRALGVLAQAAASLGQAESLAAIATVAVESGRVLFQTQRAALLLHDRHGDARFYRVLGLGKELQRAVETFQREKIHPDDSPWLLPDVRQAPLPLQKHLLRERVGAIAMFPLVCGNERRGELVICDEAPHSFSEGERLLGQTLAGLVAGAIARQRRWEDLVGVLANAREVLFTTDTQWHWTYLNPAWEDLTGYPVAASLRTVFWDGVHPEDLPAVLAQLEQLEAGQNLPLEFRYRGRNGQYRWLEMSTTPHADPWGQWVGMAGILRDVGDRRQMEIERQRYREAEAALSQAQALQTSRNQFFAMASHELRTPIGAILSNVNILEYTCDRENPKAVRALQRIQRSLQELIGVLNDVLAIGRLDAGKVEFQPRWLDLRDLCEHRIEELVLAREETRRVVFACEAERVPFYGDAKLLRYLLDNLIANGLKYSPVEWPVEVTLTVAAHQITIAIRDHGIGIAESDRERLFEPFFRGQNVGSVVGSGLGLAIVKRYADLHGARLTCESQLGKGSTFRVEFPAAPLLEPERIEPAAYC